MSSLCITRARVINAMGYSPKMIGSNSRLQSHGAQTRDPIVREGMTILPRRSQRARRESDGCPLCVPCDLCGEFRWYGGQYHFTGMSGWGVVVNERVYNEKYRGEEKIYGSTA